MTLGEYSAYLMSILSESSCVKASDILCVSHDEVNRFLVNAKHKDENQKVPKAIDNGEPEAIRQLTDAIEAWLKSQIIEEEFAEDGTVKQKMGAASFGMLNKLKTGSKMAINALKTEGNLSAKCTKENFDLIAWFVVNS